MALRPEKDNYWRAAFSRNIGLLGAAEQRRLSERTIAIPGLGGVGGEHLLTLARTGIGAFNLADPEKFEPASLNRQSGAFVSTIGRSKLEVMRALALDINPYLEIKSFEGGVTAENVDEFLAGVDAVVDGLDFFELGLRRLLFKRARELNIPVITAGPIGFGCSLLVFLPGEGMGFDEYFGFEDGQPAEEQFRRFAVGLTPDIRSLKYMDRTKFDFRAKRGPSLALASDICAGMASMEAIRIFLDRGKSRPAPHYVRFDTYLQSYRRGYLRGGNAHPFQRLKLAYLARAAAAFESQRRRNAPELPRPNPQAPLSEEELRFLVQSAIQAPSGDNAQHWRFTFDGKRLSIFNDPKRAEASYSAFGEPTYMALGAAIENLRIAATQLSRRAVVNLLGALDGRDPVATVEFEPSGDVPDPLFPFIFERRADRRSYRKEPLSREVIEALNAMVVPNPESLLHWFVDEPEMKRLASMAYRSDKILWEDEELHHDLMKWIRWDKEEAAKEGMHPSNLGLNAFERLLLPILSKSIAVRVGRYIGLNAAVAAKTRRWMLASGAHCIVTVPDREPKSYLAGGMLMQRFWIAAYAVGLSVQPISGSIMLTNHLRKPESRFTRRQHAILKEVEREYNDLLSGSLASVPLMLFRVGYAKSPSSRKSGRRPVEEVLTIVKGA